MSKIIGVIPARYQSSRYPGKMLAPLLGKTLIQQTYENTKRCGLFNDLYIACDDGRVYDHVTSFGAVAIMTPPSCPTGTDRIAVALQSLNVPSDAIIINIQGDEPCVAPFVFEEVAKKLLDDVTASMSTAVTLLPTEAAEDRTVVKCVMDQQQNALYFSRSLLPAGHKGTMNATHAYYKHLGVYGFRYRFLIKFLELPATPLQLAEDIEALKAIEHGYRIKVAIVNDPGLGVNTPEDMKKVEQYLCNQNTSSSTAASARR